MLGLPKIYYNIYKNTITKSLLLSQPLYIKLTNEITLKAFENEIELITKINDFKTQYKTYKNNKLLSIYYYQTEDKKSYTTDSMYNRILKVDESINYWANGKLKILEYYDNGQREGKYISFYSNGTKHTEGFYHNGHITGEYKHYNYKGLLISHGYYSGVYFKIELTDDIMKTVKEKYPEGPWL
jgi:antitoxin component YwqK of YwqJK toxin-antitoxin module